MRGLVLLIAVAASAQENRGFVNPKLATQNFVRNSLNQPQKPSPALVPPPANCKYAIPLLQVQGVDKDVDRPMVIHPGAKSGDEKMILPAVPACGKD